MSFRKKDKSETPATPKDKYASFLKRHLCTFRTAGRRCQILGGHEDRGEGSGLCSWHWLNQNTPEFLQDYKEFKKYRQSDRDQYPKEWQWSSCYVDDDLTWACTLGKEQHIEFDRALRVVENECDEKVFGKGHDSKDAVSDHPPTPEVSVQKYAENLPF